MSDELLLRKSEAVICVRELAYFAEASFLLEFVPGAFPDGEARGWGRRAERAALPVALRGELPASVVWGSWVEPTALFKELHCPCGLTHRM